MVFTLRTDVVNAGSFWRKVSAMKSGTSNLFNAPLEIATANGIDP